MKRLLFTAFGVAVMCISLSAQIKLTAKTHGFRVGDSHDFILMKTVEEGATGANVIWDFTSLVATDKTLTSHMLAGDVTEKTKAFPQSNLVLEEFGNHFVFNVSKDGMEQYGTVSCNTVTTYDKPFVKLKFPFEYGDKVTGQYSGIQETANSKVPVSGTYEIESDAYGTLLLPNNVEISNVLRVKQTRIIEYGNGSKITELTYRWYAEQVRYPVLVVIKYIYPQQTYIAETALYAHTTNSLRKSATEVESINAVSSLDVFPNPYEEKLTISYSLSKAGKVKIDLYDVSGKMVKNVLKATKQQGGFNTLTLESSDNGMNAGIYYVRVTVDNNAYTKKVVKLK